MLTIGERRSIFQKYYPMISVNKQLKLNEGALMNSCPACGYFTLMGRGNFDICPICFWEDEGSDNREINKESKANEHTLADHRTLVNEWIKQILSTQYQLDDLKHDVKVQLESIDDIMKNMSIERRRELLTEQGKLISLFTFNKIFGLQGLLKE